MAISLLLQNKKNIKGTLDSTYFKQFYNGSHYGFAFEIDKLESQAITMKFIRSIFKFNIVKNKNQWIRK